MVAPGPDTLWPMVDTTPAIVVDGVTKDFRIPRERVHTLKERVVHPLRRNVMDTMHGLRDVSFVVEPGEFFGIAGRNGSGKSTLLKCLAGIYGTDGGEIYVNGRLSTFIELGVGFNPDLAAYDNVMINAAMLGLSSREARRRYDRIIEFAELSEFTELKIKNYSSGMLVRLAFSVMIQVDAEILLIDEVLAVGDAAFQQKCFDEFARIRRRGTTVVLVTHDMSSVRRFCDRAMLLEAGRVVEIGDPDRIGQRYLDLNFSERARAEQGGGRFERDEPAQPPAASTQDSTDGEDPRRRGDRAAEVLEVWMDTEDGDHAEIVQNWSRVTALMRVRFRETVENPLFGILVEDDFARPVVDMNNLNDPPSGRFAPGDVVTVAFEFPAVMAQGRHWLTATVAHAGTGEHVMDRRERLADVLVQTRIPTIGTASTPFAVRVERAAESVL
jgi:ABC-type polysaccharide/polyol phosphate transport system ATPase subunit